MNAVNKQKINTLFFIINDADEEAKYRDSLANDTTGTRVATIGAETDKALVLLCEMADYLIQQHENTKYDFRQFMQLMRQLIGHVLIVVDNEVVNNEMSRCASFYDSLHHTAHTIVQLNLPFLNRLDSLAKPNALYSAFVLSKRNGNIGSFSIKLCISMYTIMPDITRLDNGSELIFRVRR